MPAHATMAVDRDPVLAELDDLVAGLQAGDARAFRRCYELTADLLASIALGMLGDRQDAEDAVQDVFLALTRRATALRGDGRSLRAWLVRAVRNTAVDRLRARGRRREQPVAQLPERRDPDGFPSDLAELDPQLSRALGRLTDKQRTALLLRHVAGMSGHEIAEVLGSDRDAVYALVARAERALRRHLEGDGPVGSDATTSSLPVAGAHGRSALR